MKTLDAICVTSIVAAVISLPFWIIFAWPIWSSKVNTAVPQWRERIADASTVIFIAGVLIAFAAASTAQEIAHNEVVAKLRSITHDYTVSVNGRGIGNPEQILGVLQSIDWLPAHHSNPTKRITLDVGDRTSHVVLSLARDSNNPQEYWVFSPNGFITRENEIGRIRTNLLDSY
ncbi:MAG TPA: hypothetical protein VFA58_03535 [Chthoniobacterales bacterium]|nr:hypothetical protein [Chthoniobacterales bacterium]